MCWYYLWIILIMYRGLGMMTPNGLQPFSTISYANGPGFNDHFDQVITGNLPCSHSKSFRNRLPGFGRISQRWTLRCIFHLYKLNSDKRSCWTKPSSSLRLFSTPKLLGSLRDPWNIHSVWAKTKFPGKHLQTNGHISPFWRDSWRGGCLGVCRRSSGHSKGSVIFSGSVISK